MPHFAIYDTATGRIRQTGACPLHMIDRQAVGAGEAIILADEGVNDRDFLVDAGEIVPKPPAAPTPADLKAHVETLRLRYEAAGTTAQIKGETVAIDTTPDSVARLLALRASIRWGDPVTGPDSKVPYRGGGKSGRLTPADFEAAYAAGVAYVAAIYEAQAAAEAAIDDGSATTPEEAEAAFSAALPGA